MSYYRDVQIGTGTDKNVSFDVSDRSRSLSIQLAVGGGSGSFAPYDGATEVESLLHNSFVLHTKNKTMNDNITVLPITILDVDNLAGGYTVTIGKF